MLSPQITEIHLLNDAMGNINKVKRGFMVTMREKQHAARTNGLGQGNTQEVKT